MLENGNFGEKAMGVLNAYHMIFVCSRLSKHKVYEVSNFQRASALVRRPLRGADGDGLLGLKDGSGQYTMSDPERSRR